MRDVLIAVPLSADWGRPDPGMCRGLTDTLLAIPERIAQVCWGPNDLGGAGAVSLQRQFAAQLIAGDRQFSGVLFIDSDIVFSASHVRRLLAHHLHLVSGFYVTKDVEGRCIPVTGFNRGDGELVPMMGRRLEKIAGAGLGFCWIAREVFTALISPWFIPGAEDFHFFRAASTAGFQAWCDYSIEVGHAGRKIWTRSDAEQTAIGLGLMSGNPDNREQLIRSTAEMERLGMFRTT